METDYLYNFLIPPIGNINDDREWWWKKLEKEVLKKFQQFE